MRRLFTAVSAAALLVASAASAQQAPDRRTINGILDQGMNHSEVMTTAAYLTDRIGGRLTNSPQMREAERWTQQQFREWGLSNVHAEPFQFGRGWSTSDYSARMTAPRALPLRVIPVAWTPGTNGVISGEVILAPMANAGDLEKYRGKLAGKIVMISAPTAQPDPTEAPFRRWTDEELADRTSYSQPNNNPAAAMRGVQASSRDDFPLRRDAFLREEGALGWISMSYRDGGLVHGSGYTHLVGRTPVLPGLEMAAEDYRRLARLYVAGTAPAVEMMSQVQFHDEDANANNIIADIPGTSGSEYVMAGAHLDSWVAADGAVDNAAGSAVIMEAARILKAMNVRPKRTIRFALWAGEEQGLWGSLAYVDQHLATRAPLGDPALDALANNRTWRARWPIQPRSGYRDLVAYFNIDNGSGRIRGINAEGNIAAVPYFEKWLEPFHDLGAETVSLRNSGGTDHVYMQTVGIPGFQFIQDPLDYNARLHHTSVDTYDHMKPEDLRQAAVILASILLSAANSDEPLPRMPMPTQPTPSDPFAPE